MIKYRKVREKVQAHHVNNQYVKFTVSPLATRDELITTHCPNYVDRYLKGQLTEKENRKIGFPWSLNSVNRTLSSVGGTIGAMRDVMNRYKPNQSIAACHIAGGTHHAFYDYGEGFCIFSDIAVAINIAFHEYSFLKNILIIDLDVHQGNGNAVLLQSNPMVFTCSFHCKTNYFSMKQMSDLDIEINEGCRDEEYLQQLYDHLPALFELLRPQLVFFQAGIDIHQYDRLGKLNITRHGIIERNRFVYQLIQQYHSNVVVTMGGGYPLSSEVDSVEFQEIIQSHADVYLNCIDAFTKKD